MLRRARSDDDLEIIRERFWQHKRLTQPLLEYYGSRGLLKEIRAEGTPDELMQRDEVRRAYLGV